MEQFVVSAEILNHPVFVGLLNKSAQEYGYEQQGGLRIPCHVLVFERVMEAIRLGLESHDLLSSTAPPPPPSPSATYENCRLSDLGFFF
ncbi:unnamed protein product [Linum trigynum]|uniref:Uncharacterized protein n=1 Tax=Linum trigynum TaxID=586398 RepID=A0AAV2GPH0_9ROSI